MITYYKLLDMLNRKGISKMELKKAIGCGSNTLVSNILEYDEKEWLNN